MNITLKKSINKWVDVISVLCIDNRKNEGIKKEGISNLIS